MKRLLAGTIVSLFLLTGTTVFATDFSKYSTEELAKMRGTMWQATEQEREAFRAEWQKRVQNMSPEQRRQYIGKPANAGLRAGRGMMKGRGYGRR